MADITYPTIQDVYKARGVVRKFIPPTQLLKPWALCDRLGFDIYIKCESMTPIGAFKVRGGLYLMSTLTDGERRRGVVAASTGNHGQSIAYSARAFGVRAVVYAPVSANPIKVASMRKLGAEVRLMGSDYEASKAFAEQAAVDEGLVYVHASDEVRLYPGVGTATLEIIEEVPDIDVFFVPIGGGSGACGMGMVVKALLPTARVIGVQAQNAPSVYLSWKSGEPVETPPVNTFADGLATRQAYPTPLGLLKKVLDDIVLVTEEEMENAVAALMETAHVVAEGAGAAATAAAIKLTDELKGKKVAVMLSGGNITMERVKHIVSKV